MLPTETVIHTCTISSITSISVDNGRLCSVVTLLPGMVCAKPELFQHIQLQLIEMTEHTHYSRELLIAAAEACLRTDGTNSILFVLSQITSVDATSTTAPGCIQDGSTK